MGLLRKKKKETKYSLSLPLVTDLQDNTGITREEIAELTKIAKGYGHSFRKFVARVLRHELIRRLHG